MQRNKSLNYMRALILPTLALFLFFSLDSQGMENLCLETPNIKKTNFLDLPNDVIKVIFKFGGAKSAHGTCQRIRGIARSCLIQRHTFQNEAELERFNTTLCTPGFIFNCLFPLKEEHIRGIISKNPSLHAFSVNGKQPSFPKLSLRHLRLLTLNFVVTCNNIELLDLGYTGIKCIAPLANMPKLKTLMINNNPINNISSITSLPTLETLYIHNTGIPSFDSLRELNNLTHLNANGCPVVDITALSVLTQLRQLYLHSTPIKEIDSLKGLTNLEYLNLSCTSISSIIGLANMRNLKGFFMDSSPLVDVSPLESAIYLVKLYLPKTKVENIRVLQLFTCLEQLTLSHTLVSDLSSIKNLPLLRVLNIEGVKNAKEMAESMGARKELKISY